MTENKTHDFQRLWHNCRHYWPWVVVGMAILFTAAIRIRLLDIPLERDEGEYAYAGQLILRGIPPYVQVYTMKMPGIYVAYALILAVLGQTHTGIHLGLLIINAATVLLLFLLAKELFHRLVAVVTAVAFALLSLGQPVQGVFANAEHFVILPALCGILLLIRAVNSRKYLPLLPSALLLGLAFLMKQHGAVFIVFAGLYLLFCESSHRPFKWKLLVAKGAIFTFGALLPFVLSCLILWWLGVFEKFWFLTFGYAREYVSSVPLLAGLNVLKTQITQIADSAVLVWILAGIGLISFFWNKKVRQHSLFVIGFLFFSFLAVCPGMYFRLHYFILLLPAIALLVGIGADSTYHFFARNRVSITAKVVPILLALIVLFHTLYQQRNFLFRMSPTAISRACFGANPFPESLEIAHFIRENSTVKDRIAVIGSEPQIYFYANRRSATGYIYTYALMENHPYAARMQKEMIEEVEAASPEYLVFVSVSTSWLARPDSEKMIFEWVNQYCQKYDTVGVIDIISKDLTIYCWGDSAAEYSLESKNWLVVFERKSDI